MEDNQFAILVKMIESIDKKIDDFKFDVNRRFEQVDKQFEQVAREFVQTRDLIKEEKRDREKMEEKLEKVYESRDKVTVTFGRAFPIFNAFLSAVVAFIVAYFTKN